ncbi:hypothetical protein B0H16DRAFT_1628527 [Mycena metata]|uniref:Hydrophobin n=1 Tax=Mycena metata TaxID=1033252 RepID=A0AAD7MCX2_9AGAR|nr:hypothetical protein B0H16DRAFT_1628527 [Mycena metata]
MFSKLSAVAAYVLIAAAATLTGTPPPPITPPTSLQCCERVVPSTSDDASRVAAVLGIDLDGLNVPIGLACGNEFEPPNTPCGDINLICDAPEEEWGSLIAINCFPVTAGMKS